MTNPLIERAKAVQSKKNGPGFEEISDEEIELAMAYLKNEITSGQIARATNESFNPYRILNAIRRASAQGLIIIK